MSIGKDLVGAGRILKDLTIKVVTSPFFYRPLGWLGIITVVGTGVTLGSRELNEVLDKRKDKKLDNKSALTKPVQDKAPEPAKKVEPVNSKAAEAAKSKAGTVYIKIDKPVKKVGEEAAKSKADTVYIKIDKPVKKVGEEAAKGKAGTVYIKIDKPMKKVGEEAAKSKADTVYIKIDKPIQSKAVVKKPTHDPVDSKVSAQKFVQKDGAVDSNKVAVSTKALALNNVAATVAADPSHHEDVLDSFEVSLAGSGVQ